MKFYAPGKLMISGEYLVLDGAHALGLPCKYGQYLEVVEGEINTKPKLFWTSYDHNRTQWFSAKFAINDINIECISTENNYTSDVLVKLLQIILKNKPNIFQKHTDYYIKTSLKFNRDWGLGSSSSLIATLAAWSGVNAYKLLEYSFSGSGYDVAIAQHKTPILYQNINRKRTITSVELRWKFKDKLFFIYQNRKQNSQEQIRNYRALKKPNIHLIDQISQIGFDLSNCSKLEEFESLLTRHELLLAQQLKKDPLAKTFPQFNGLVKSLGAWGGDFFLATGNSEDMTYFKNKGFDTILTFDQLFDTWKSMK